MRNTSQDPEYEGLPYHEKKLHKTHFGAVKQYGGNERVRVRTAQGYAFVSRIVAEEEGLKIIPQKSKKRTPHQRRR